MARLNVISIGSVNRRLRLSRFSEKVIVEEEGAKCNTKLVAYRVNLKHLSQQSDLILIKQRQDCLSCYLQ